jgi:hypothetical protein
MRDIDHSGQAVQIRPEFTQHRRMFVAIVNEMDDAPITRFRRRGRRNKAAGEGPARRFDL